MNTMSPGQLAALYREACALDVQAFKPGNVSLRSPGHGMTADDFLRSAESSASAICRVHLTLGERIHNAVFASFDAVGCNTNLGIVLLCAPVIQACIEYPQLALRQGVKRVLSDTSVDDSEAVFAAIRLVRPGGLSEIDEHDVAEPARLRLSDVMRQASTRDLIARQYSHGFAELFDDIQPRLENALKRHAEPAAALSALFIDLLARYPDTHVWRKHGAVVAMRVTRMASDTRRQLAQLPDSRRAEQVLEAFDTALKQAHLNPGTTADLCVAAYLIHRLLSQAVIPTGETRDLSRTPRPGWAEAPQTAKCQRTVEEISNGVS